MQISLMEVPVRAFAIRATICPQVKNYSSFSSEDLRSDQTLMTPSLVPAGCLLSVNQKKVRPAIQRARCHERSTTLQRAELLLRRSRVNAAGTAESRAVDQASPLQPDLANISLGMHRSKCDPILRHGRAQDVTDFHVLISSAQWFSRFVGGTVSSMSKYC
jgi:hypothetical protein